MVIHWNIMTCIEFNFPLALHSKLLMGGKKLFINSCYLISTFILESQSFVKTGDAILQHLRFKRFCQKWKLFVWDVICSAMWFEWAKTKIKCALLQATPNTVVFAKKNKGCRIPIGFRYHQCRSLSDSWLLYTWRCCWHHHMHSCMQLGMPIWTLSSMELEDKWLVSHMHLYNNIVECQKLHKHSCMLPHCLWHSSPDHHAINNSKKQTHEDKIIPKENTVAKPRLDPKKFMILLCNKLFSHSTQFCSTRIDSKVIVFDLI